MIDEPAGCRRRSAKALHPFLGRPPRLRGPGARKDELHRRAGHAAGPLPLRARPRGAIQLIYSSGECNEHSRRPSCAYAYHWSPSVPHGFCAEVQMGGAEGVLNAEHMAMTLQPGGGLLMRVTRRELTTT